MFPEVISNGLASLAGGQAPLRQDGADRVHAAPAEGRRALRQRRDPEPQAVHLRGGAGDPRTTWRTRRSSGRESPRRHPEILALLRRMRDLALLLRKKRSKRGSLELSMPEAVLEYDDHGRVTGAHFAEDSLSHQIIEEFMLAANEAVAEHFTRLDVPFLRRVHPGARTRRSSRPSPSSPTCSATRSRRPQDRFELQRVLARDGRQARARRGPLRLLAQPQAGHVHADPGRALRPGQPELLPLHLADPPLPGPEGPPPARPLDQARQGIGGRGGTDRAGRALLEDGTPGRDGRARTGEAQAPARTSNSRIGEELDAVITGVADYGFFAQAERFPAEGLVHISSLVDDYY